ncbi:MAG: GNAT family N-acetyltransferase [Halalkalicoccus sp.]
MTDPRTIRTEYDHHVYDDRIDRTISFRPATADRDLGRLHRWLNAEHVLPYWALDEPLPAFERALSGKLDDEHLTPYVGCLDHVPMSYWEAYWAGEDPLANHYEARPSDRGIHLLIGPPEYLGQGYAAPLLREMTALQFVHPEVERVVAEPDARNGRAIAVFEDCGFEPRFAFEFPEEDKEALLVTCDRDRFERRRRREREGAR